VKFPLFRATKFAQVHIGMDFARAQTGRIHYKNYFIAQAVSFDRRRNSFAKKKHLTTDCKNTKVLKLSRVLCLLSGCVPNSSEHRFGTVPARRAPVIFFSA
jgi:hypothetical protein